MFEYLSERADLGLYIGFLSGEIGKLEFLEFSTTTPS